MKLSEMTIGMRLGLGFAFVIVGGMGATSFGRYELGGISERMSALVSDRMVKYEAVTQVIDNVNRSALAARDIVLATDADVRQKKKAATEDIAASNTKIYDDLRSSIEASDGRALLDSVVKARVVYSDAFRKAVDSAVAGDEAQARDVLANALEPAQAAYVERLSAFREMERQRMHEDTAAAQQIAQLAGWLMLFCATLGSGCGALAAWLVSRLLRRQLGGEPLYATRVAKEIAAGNLNVRVETEAGDEASLLAAMAIMRAQLAEVVSRVREGAESVANASAEIDSGNTHLSTRTQSQASSIEQTAASMEQLGATVRNNAENAKQANQLARSASDIAGQGGEVVGQVVQTMNGIRDSSRKISEIIGVIDGIAFQTNILALNAAVEAARAGEQGRGFAVVAGEVRSLARRSGEAAKEIKALITASVGRVEEGSKLVSEAGQTMNEVVSSIRRVTDIMQEISAASEEQSAGVGQVGQAITVLDRATHENSALVGQMATSVSSLSEQARDLVQAVGAFKVEGGVPA